MKHGMIFFGGLIAVIGLMAGACWGADGDERFSGGSYDGYDVSTDTDTTIQSGLPAGTIFMIR